MLENGFPLIRISNIMFFQYSGILAYLHSDSIAYLVFCGKSKIECSCNDSYSLAFCVKGLYHSPVQSPTRVLNTTLRLLLFLMKIDLMKIDPQRIIDVFQVANPVCKVTIEQGVGRCVIMAETKILSQKITGTVDTKTIVF